MLSRGCILPIVSYMKDCMDNESFDVSLLRHFVVEVCSDVMQCIYCQKFYTNSFKGTNFRE